MPRPKDPDILVDLTTARTEFEAHIIVRALEARGIPAQAHTAAGAMLQLEVIMSQPMRITVRRRDLEAAADLLNSIRAQSGVYDWSKLDPGAPMSLQEISDTCLECGYDLSGLPPDARCPECGKDLLGALDPPLTPSDAGPPLSPLMRSRRNRRRIIMVGLIFSAVVIVVRLFI
jgi:hypothetical protein